MFMAVLIVIFLNTGPVPMPGAIASQSFYPTLQDCLQANAEQEKKMLQVSADKHLQFKYQLQCIEVTDANFHVADGLTHM
jgi:hypothetical protein